MIVAPALFALILASAPPGDDLAARFEALRAEAATAPSRRLPAAFFAEFADRFLALADEAPGGPVDLAARLAVAEYGSALIDTAPFEGVVPEPRMRRALEGIARRHLGDERVGRLALALARLPSPAREDFLRTVVRDADDRSVRGRACLALGELLKNKLVNAEALDDPPPPGSPVTAEQVWGPAYFAQLRSLDRAALRAEAEAALERAAAEFADVPYIRWAGATPAWTRATDQDRAAGRTLGAVAAGDLDEIRSLAVGRVAPEIEGPDADGVPFKLSDHRGRVVLLTFSGNWCAPCRGLYPFERDLVARLKGRPFALLGVNTDEAAGSLRDSIRAGEITWRCWWAGSPAGAIPTRWNVKTWPTTYVLDDRGVIRAKNPPFETIDRLIDDLIAEALARPARAE